MVRKAKSENGLSNLKANLFLSKILPLKGLHNFGTVPHWEKMSHLEWGEGRVSTWALGRFCSGKRLYLSMERGIFFCG